MRDLPERRDGEGPFEVDAVRLQQLFEVCASFDDPEIVKSYQEAAGMVVSDWLKEPSSMWLYA